MILFSHKVLSFELVGTTRYDNVIFLKAFKELKTFFFFLFLFFLTIAFNWFIVSLKYHPIFTTIISLIPLGSYFYLKFDKSNNDLKISKAIITSIPLLGLSFSFDYISWRWFVSTKLSIMDKSVGLINPPEITWLQSIMVNIGFKIIFLIIILFLARSVINYLGLFKLRKELNDTNKRIEEEDIPKYLKKYSAKMWKIAIPLLIISLIYASLMAIPFLITLITKSIN